MTAQIQKAAENYAVHAYAAALQIGTGDVAAMGEEGERAVAEVERIIAAAISADRRERDGNGRTHDFFQVGTLVRLTGASWDEYGIRGESVTVGVESWPDRRSENYFRHNGLHFVLLKTDTEDYTATAILPTIGDKR